MLLTKEVEIKVNAKNIEWYNKKGYISNLRDIITVKIEDLSKGCKVPIEYECDNCKTVITIAFTDFVRRHISNEKHYCSDCTRKKPKINPQYFANNGFKICTKCERRLPANTDYFIKNKHGLDGFCTTCKECQGYQFTNKLTHIPKIGFKFCVKCDRELPIDIKYFPPDKDCKDGFRNVCRECGKDGHFMEDGYVPNTWWSKESEQLLIDNYALYTNSELIEMFFPNETHKSLQNKAYGLGITGKNDDVLERVNKEKSEKLSGENSPLYGTHLSAEQKRKLSIAKKGKYIGVNNPLYGVKWAKDDPRRLLISERTKGKWSGSKNPRVSNPLSGKDNPNWKGGITPLYFELRSEIKEWQKSSMIECNYKCVLTGDTFDEIHHLYPFRKIVDEVFIELNLDQRKSVKDYTENEFDIIKIKLYELHIKYGLGVCLRKDVHKLFHDLYGYKNNTPEQFNEFSIRFKTGEFNEILRSAS
jgi:hypothetical protein